MEADVTVRFEAIESKQRALDAKVVSQDAANVGMIAVTGAFTHALDIQRDSLSIPLLRDVLLPIIIRMFSFFALLVIVLVTAMLGIKWIATDILKLGSF